MRVSIVNIRGGHTQSPGLPLSLAFLGGVLRDEKHEVQLIDPLVMTDDQVVNAVEAFEPDLIGLSTMTLNFKHAIYIHQRLKEKTKRFSKKVYTCAGGLHPTVMPKDAVAKLGADFIAIGEGENTIKNICNEIHRTGKLDITQHDGVGYIDANGKIVLRTHQIVENLDSLPMPAYELLDMDLYLRPPGFIRGMIFNRVASVMFSRGCPYPCTYCSSSAMFLRKYRYHSPAYMQKQIQHLVDQYGIDAYYFTDETFTLHKKVITELLEGLKPLGLPWGASTRVNLVDEELLRVMRDAGCVHLDFGVESGSQAVRDRLKRRQKREDFQKTFDACKALGIRRFAQVMVGNPQETVAEVDETIDMLKALRPTYTMVSIFTPLPGTEAYRDFLGQTDCGDHPGKENLEAKKKEEEYITKLYDFDIANTDYPLANVSSMTDAEILESRSRVLRSMFWNNYRNMITGKHLQFLLKCLFASLFNPKKLAVAFLKAAKEGRIEFIVYALIFNYISFYKLTGRKSGEGKHSSRKSETLKDRSKEKSNENTNQTAA